MPNVLSVENIPKVPAIWDPPERRSNYQFVVEELVWDGTIQDARSLATAYSVTMATLHGWKRILRASAITGNPKAYVQVWEVPRRFEANESEVAQITASGALQRSAAFLDHVSTLERWTLDRMPYDESARPDLVVGETVMLVRASVRDGAMARLAYMKEHFFLKTVTDPEKIVAIDGTPMPWSLLFSGHVTARTKPGSTILQAWKMPDSRALTAAMVRMGHEELYGKYVAPCISEEDQNLYSVISDN